MLPQKNPPKSFDWDVLLIFSGEKVLMRQRTETMLHGLWVFPMLPGHTDNLADFGAQMHMNLRNVRPRGREACFHAPNLADEAVSDGRARRGCAEGVSVCYAE